MNSISYYSKEYQVLKTQIMADNLAFKLVQFKTGYYGIISYNPKTNKEQVILLSPDAGNNVFDGLGCRSFLSFAQDAKKYLEESPIELVVKLGKDAPTEYRETITRDQAKTLYEKVEICNEIMSMKIEESFHYKYGDLILFILMGVIILLFIVAIVNTLGVI